jgi:carboxyl-terminal processing protease
VADDLTRPLGDPNEGMLAAALSRRATGQCPAVTAQTQSVRAIGVAAPFDGRLVRNPVRENKFRVPR